MSSCNDPNEVGVGVQPANDQPGVFDTSITSLTTFTILEDSLLSSSSISPMFLGSLNDNETGTTYASFYTQVRLGSSVTATTFNGATTPDKIELVLGLVKDVVYGDSKKMHHISVYQINESMYKDSVYYSTDTFSIGNMIGHTDIIPRVGYGTSLDGVPMSPQIKIPLDTAFGGYLMRELTARLPTNKVFLDSVLRGIYIIDSTEGSGSIINVYPVSALNRMNIYFNDSAKFALEINDASARSLNFKHDYCNSYSVSPQVCNPTNPTMSHDTVFVQSLAGLKTKLILPDWKQVFKNKVTSINRADIVISVKSGTEVDPFKPHDNLLLLAADSIGKNTITADFLDLGGAYNSTTKEYKLNFTRHLQQILNGTVKDYGLYIVAGGSTSNARRTVLNGGTSMKITITYTQQND